MSKENVWLHLGIWCISKRTIVLSIILDEKEKFEPTVFRDTLVQGLNEAGDDLEAVAKFLDSTGSRLDYRRYADTLFDILVAGSMLGKPYTRASCSIMYFQFYRNIFLWDRIFISFTRMIVDFRKIQMGVYKNFTWVMIWNGVDVAVKCLLVKRELLLTDNTVGHLSIAKSPFSYMSLIFECFWNGFRRGNFCIIVQGSSISGVLNS